ncbi:PP2C family protein-serine/threonine phosphatase [Treponema brennaborense]|uniref:Stage II sporulation protein E n=1 Tax=Treponema brennaborense (strain DSM 12168 / CIP 105900 / DD5/3) TaxID=906968 RepID=F4LPY8_TREBD|nr:PP2C family protein-serine/threonine phosphatase [Treponema brennaborense]AEE16080.1 Stage II sporulation protein E [Treponema brennaborense DSM 12168]
MNSPIEFEIAADVLSAVAAFSKEIASQPVSQVDAEFFISAVQRFTGQLYGFRNAALYYRSEPDGPVFCSLPEAESPCERSSFESRISTLGKIETEYRNPGTFVKAEFHAYLCVSFFIKKVFFFSIVVCGKKSEIRQAERTAPFLHAYLASEFRRVRKSKKELQSVKKSEQEAFLLRTKRILKTRKSAQRWFADDGRSALDSGTDFSGLYPCRKDVWLSCLCDVTVPSDARASVLLMIDAYMAMLSRSGSDAETVVRRIGQAIHDKSMEMYASVVCTLYDKGSGTVTVCGAGSCRAYYVHHDSGRCSELVFGEPLGSKSTVPEKFPLEIRVLNVSPGDVLFLCSDGIATAQKKNGGTFENDAIAAAVKKYAALSASYLMEKMYKFLDDTCGVYRDDCTCQVFKYE